MSKKSPGRAKKAVGGPSPKTMEAMLSAAGTGDPQLERTFRGHRGAVKSTSFSSTMRQLVSGGEDGCLMLWNFRPTLRAFRFVGHKAPITNVEFSPSGNLIASSSKDRTVRLWLPNPKGESTVLKGHMGAVRAASFSPNGRLLLTASDDKTAKLWELTGRRFLCTLAGHSNWVRTAKFAPDGRLASTGSDDKTVKLWEVSQHQCLHTFFDHSGYVSSVDFSPDGTCLAAASADNSLKVWDTRSYLLLQHYPAHSGPANCVQFHPTGLYILSASEDSTLKIWDVREGRLLYTIHGHQGGVSCASWNADGTFFASGGEDQLVMVWRANLGSEGVPAGLFDEKETTPARRHSGGRKSIPTTAPPSHFTDPNSSFISSPPRVSKETYDNIWDAENGNNLIFPQYTESHQKNPGMFPPPPLQTEDLAQEEYIRHKLNASAFQLQDTMNRTSETGKKFPPTSTFTLPIDRDALPEALAGTLDHIVGQLDLITRTLAVMEQRLTFTEDNVQALAERGVFITNQGMQFDSYENEDKKQKRAPRQFDISAHGQQDSDNEDALHDNNPEVLTHIQEHTEVTEEIVEVLAEVQHQIYDLLQEKPQMFKVVFYKSQALFGMHYAMKIQVSPNQFIHVKVFKPLPHVSMEAELKGLEVNKTFEDLL